jgi:hypothetical protein
MKTKAQLRHDLAVHSLLALLELHPERRKLLKAGKQRDDLLRALIPLYAVGGTYSQQLFTSGSVSTFWKLNGVKIQAPRVARAYRTHIGYARMTRYGRVITPNGRAYVLSALGRLP